MFKKKAKKEQGVLNLEEHQPALQQDTQEGVGKAEGGSAVQGSTVNVHPIDHKHHHSGQIDHSHGQNHPEIERAGNPQQSTGKRAKNPEESYNEDHASSLQNQPKKRIKEGGFNGKAKHIISNNTYAREQQISDAVHESFQDINYKAGKNMIKDLQLPADELEEELAKKRFLENVQTTRLVKEGKLNTKIYRGINAYANHKMTNNEIQTAEESYKKKMGPSRINSTIKNSCRFDYVLNLCKDWHDSGYCPFGNSCLYLHDRSNLKTGWELEKDFQASERQRWRRINNPELAQKEDREKMLRTIQKYKPQQICNYCSKQFDKPVQVDCGHVYCRPCALKLVKCKECGKRLSGIMNEAKEKLEKQKTVYAQMVAKLQSGEEQVQTQRRKFQNVDSIDVFAD